MKNTLNFTLSSVILAVIFTGCHSKSYYAAQNVNQQRFDGQKQETAEFLTEIHNLTLLMENLSQLTLQQSESREAYLTARDMEEKLKKIQLKITMEATFHRIKLSGVLSEKHDMYYQKLKKVYKEDFDKQYIKMMIEKLEELNDAVIKYQVNGHNDRIKKLSREVENMVTREMREFKNSDLS